MRGIIRLSAVPAGPRAARVARVHRTTTTATLLVSVAVSALTGCVTVQQRPTAPGPAAPSVPPLPRPDARTATQVVQAPVREALEMLRPSPEQEPPAPAAPRDSPSAHHRQRTDPEPRHHPTPRHSSPRPHIELPDVEKEVRRRADVCELGRQYGGWTSDSTESQICDQTYGR